MLAAVGLANMFINITTLSVIIGINSTLNTLVSQSFGLQNYKLCGVYFNRARIIMTLVLVPLSILLLNTERVFDLMGFDREASYYSLMYIYMLIPALWVLGLLDANRRLLSCMGYQNVPMAIQITNTFLHILWCWLFTDCFGFGIQGPSIATLLTNLLNLLMVHIYTVRFTDVKVTNEAYLMPSNECFDITGLKEYMKLGLPSIGMTCLEWLSFEVMTLYSAYISITATAI
jgi:MATE family multidrug resistance protein